MDGVSQVHSMRLVSVQSDDDSLLLVVRISRQHRLIFGSDSGQYGAGLSITSEGQVVIGSVLATRRDLNVGDQLSLKSGSGSAILTVAELPMIISEVA